MPIRLKQTIARVLLAALALAAAALPGAAQTIATYHGRADRSGNYVMPGMTWQRAGALRLDPGFQAHFAGHLYAQPLYWRPAGPQSGLLIVASESNMVAALEAATGKTLWSRTLGPPAPLSDFPCGNIDPLGVTGTPVLDPASGVLYLDAMVADAGGPRHKLYALSAATGAVLPDWPIDVGNALQAIGQKFNSGVQNQRGALLLLNGMLYVPYGGFFGDCGDYHGRVVGVPLDDPKHVIAWRTAARGGAVWAPGGIASDGQFLYVATGNTIGARQWGDGEAVIRLAPDLHHSDNSGDFFAPTDWRQLDERDADLGGSNPLLLTVHGGSGVQRLLLALGKDTRGYLIDRLNLGGIGGSLVAERVASGPIRTSPVVYPGGDPDFVAFQGRGAHCPAGQGGDLTVLRIRPGSPPAMDTVWCGATRGGGSPIVTTTDGRNDPVVWILGAEGDNRLHGFRGDTGTPLLESAPLAGLRHFQTLIAADNRLFVGADDRIYAFGLGQ